MSHYENQRDRSLIYSREQQDKVDAIKAKDAEAVRMYVDAVRKIFSTPEGVIFGRGLIYLLGVNEATPIGKDYALNVMVDNTRREVYYKFIRAYLTPNQKTKLEIGE